MGLFGLFKKPEDTFAPIVGNQIGPLTVNPHSGSLPTISPAPTAMPTLADAPGVTLPTPGLSDTPAQPLGGLNVSQPAKKD